MTARQEVPVRWCPSHDEIAYAHVDPEPVQCHAAWIAHLVKPCPLVPLFYEIPEGDTPNE